MLDVTFTSGNIAMAVFILASGYLMIIARRISRVDSRNWKFEPTAAPLVMVLILFLADSFFNFNEICYAIYCLASLAIFYFHKDAWDTRVKMTEGKQRQF